MNNYFIRLRDTQQECAKEDVANSLPEAENMLKAHEDLKVRMGIFILEAEHLSNTFVSSYKHNSLILLINEFSPCRMRSTLASQHMKTW
jgi:hypothetical protein